MMTVWERLRQCRWQNAAWLCASAALVFGGSVAPGALANDASMPLKEFCAVPDDLKPAGFLKHTRDSYRAGKPFRIVVIGTSSSAGTGSAARGEAYAARLQGDLEQHFTLPVTVMNVSVGGQSARRMAVRFEDDVISKQPALVIWQTGTVDAARNMEVEDFGQALSQGIEILDKEGIDVVLINMQYSRRMELLVNHWPYVEMMKAAAVQSDAVLFDRLEMMRYWAAEGRLDFDNMPRAERASRAVKLHECIALQLGDMIEKAVRR